MRLVVLLVAALALLPAGARAQSPRITPPSGIVMQAKTGEVVWQKDADAPLPIASTTKLMTALVVLEEADLDAVLTAPRYQATSSLESVVGLIGGEKMTVADLLRALLVDSANDAAYALALRVGGTVPNFVRRMNARAQELGLANTSFANPIGLDDPDNYSSARDLAKLTIELRKHDFFRTTVDSETVTLKSGARPRTLTNSNDLLHSHDYVDGVKTGSTSLAGDILVASGKRRGIPIISVVIGASSEAVRDEETLELLDYGFSEYVRERVVDADQVKASLPIVDRPGAELPVVAARAITRVIREGQEFEIAINLPEEVEGPIGFREKLGEMTISVAGTRVARVPLVASLKVPAAGPGRRIQNFLTTPWTLLILGAILLAATAITQRRLRTPPAQERTA